MKTKTIDGITAPFSDENVIGLRGVWIASAKVREGAISGCKPSKLGCVEGFELRLRGGQCEPIRYGGDGVKEHFHGWLVSARVTYGADCVHGGRGKGFIEVYARGKVGREKHLQLDFAVGEASGLLHPIEELLAVHDGNEAFWEIGLIAGDNGIGL